MKIQNFKELAVWQKAMLLAKEIYTLTSEFPSDEKFGLTSQLRRCCISIPSNIAEGFGRYNKGDMAQFLRIALGSCYELETQILLSKEFNFINKDSFNNIIFKLNEIIKMIKAFIFKLSKPINQTS